MIDYRFLLPAEEEMTEAAVFYEPLHYSWVQIFLTTFNVLLTLFADNRRLVGMLGRGLRRMLLHKFPFSLIYALGAEEIVIVAVAHQKRRPDYWKGRL